MTIFYIKQDNTVWCCEEDSGEYYKDIEVSFVKCECSNIEPETMEEHLQNHKGGGRVLKWRKATEKERSAWYASGDEFFEEGISFERERIIKVIPEYMKTVLSWGHETASKELIALIKGENK